MEHIPDSSNWQATLFEYFKKQLLESSAVIEDQRVADWKYLIPLNKDSVALVFGSGFGAIPVSLSNTCRRVYAVDNSPERISFLDRRKRQQKIENLFPIFLDNYAKLGFSENCFDLVSVNEENFFQKKTISLEKIFDLLKEHGYLHLNCGNSFWYSFLDHKKMLEKAGFSDIRFYAPLPDFKGVPLFYLPLDNARALNYFFESIFPLSEMVSPEAKKHYGFKFAAIKVIVKLILFFRLTRFSKFFVPGFCIIATKKGRA